MFLFEKYVKEDRDQDTQLREDYLIPLFCSADLLLKEQNLDVESNPLK